MKSSGPASRKKCVVVRTHCALKTDGVASAPRNPSQTAANRSLSFEASPMSADASIGGSGPASPRFKARITGAVYLLYFVTAIFAEFLASHGHESYGLAVNLISAAFYVAVTVLFYYLFKPVNATLS